MTHAVHRVGPDEFHWAAPTGAAAQVRGVLDASEAHDGVPAIDEAGVLALRHRGLADGVLLLSDYPAVGFAWVREGDLALVVHPDARRDGRGSDLAEAALESADVTMAWAHGNHPAAAVLADRFGFERVRDLWVMRRRLAPDDLREPAESPSGPAGVRIRTFRPGLDEEAFLALNAEAFAHHPEQGRMTRADLDERMSEPWFDPAGFFVAELTSGSPHDPTDDIASLVGFHWTKVHDGELPFGEVYVVGVSPRGQGAGLGRALTLAGLRHLAGLGLGDVLLYVESDNAAAVTVYSKLGFTHADADTHVQYRRG